MISQIKNFKNEIKERLNWDEYFKETALLISRRSPCERLHVGCVLVKNNRIISAGYNGFLPGAHHISIITEVNKHTHEQATVHAEQNAIADCANRGVSTNNAIAYITHYPCINCFKSIAACGIKEIIYNDDYNNNPLVFELAKESLITINKF